MGLLDAIFARNPEQAKGLLSDYYNGAVNGLANAPQSLGLLFDPAWQAEMAKPESQAKFHQANMDVGMGIGPGAIAWHGSPHLFDKFDLAKIGTGEGVQAYGHGVYLAESPKVAEGYSKMAIGRFTSDPWMTYSQVENGKYTDKFIATTISGKESGVFNTEKEAQDHVDELNKSLSHIYKTDIPDSHLSKMLDWDKPLSEQSQHVQDALKKQVPDWEAFKGKTGGDYVQYGLGKYGHAETLMDAGIPGIKYLDGSSRAGGEGTRNFVMFNPDDIRILEHNGQPTGQQPWGLLR